MTDNKSASIAREKAAVPMAFPSVSATTFKATCLELMDDIAKRHAQLIVTKHGRPMVKIGPVDDTPPSPIGFLRGTVIVHGDLVSPNPSDWEMSDSDPIGGATW